MAEDITKNDFASDLSDSITAYLHYKKGVWCNGYLVYNWDTNDNSQFDEMEKAKLLEVVHAFSANPKRHVGFALGSDDGPWDKIPRHRIYPKTGTLLIFHDSDGDGLIDEEENPHFPNPPDDPRQFPTDVHNYDSDGDGLSDGFEMGMFGNRIRRYPIDVDTDPLNPDTDGDGLTDACELGVDSAPKGMTDGIIYLTSPHHDISGGQRTFSWQHRIHGDLMTLDRERLMYDMDPSSITSPACPDTDHDGLLDGDEDANGNGRQDAGESNAAVGFVDSAQCGLYGQLDRYLHIRPLEMYRDDLDLVLYFQSSTVNPAPQVIVKRNGTGKANNDGNAPLRIVGPQRIEDTRFWSVHLGWNAPSDAPIDLYVIDNGADSERTPILKIVTSDEDPR